jgi:predicted metal-binding protein
MSNLETTGESGSLRTYRAPWKGQIVLVCRKCQKKLHGGKKNKIAKLGKVLKKQARHEEDAPRLRVIQVSCLNVCPKGGVTVCTQAQLARNECCIVRTPADLDALVRQL